MRGSRSSFFESTAPVQTNAQYAASLEVLHSLVYGCVYWLLSFERFVCPLEERSNSLDRREWIYLRRQCIQNVVARRRTTARV